MKFKILFLQLTIALFANAQLILSGPSCNYYGDEMDDEIGSYPSTSEAKKTVQRILDVVDLHPNFKIRVADDVPNASAVIYRNKKYILYNTKFIHAINSAATTDWTGISILAHEM